MSATPQEIQAVRIICDMVLKDDLLSCLTRLGAAGWTWWPAYGKGEHPTAAGLFLDLQSMYVEVWCNAEVAERILAYCNSSHFTGISMAVGVAPLLVSKEHAARFAKH
jgi:hypothetical protein